MNAEADPRHFVISGGSGGVGRALTVDMLKRGSRVTTIHSSDSSAARLRREFGECHRFQALVADLRHPAEVDALAGPLGSGPTIDGLIHAAGVWRDDDGAYRGPNLFETPRGQIEDIVGVGVQGAMLLTRIILQSMSRAGAGKILFISCGFAGPHEACGWVHYYTANAALEGLTRGLAAECRKYNIQVNCLAPWFVRTDHVVRFFPEDAPTALPVERVVSSLRFLLSTEADDISGQVIDLRSHRDTV